MPLVVGAEAAGEIAAVGAEVTAFKPGDPVVMYGALTCGVCKACRDGRDNLCENVAGIMGFHIDGFARDLVNMPARLVIPVPAGVSFRDAACAPIAFSTVQHMLFDNAKLEPGETVLVHAGGSGIGTVAIKMAKAIGATVITTVGDDAKAEKAKALGADHVINYRTDRFEGAVRKLTAKKGVDVVFEHVGAETFNGSLLCLKRGGTARHLRRDLGAVDDAQSDAAVSAAIPHHRLVRRFDAQHPREPRQDGGRHAAGDRHRSAARRSSSAAWRGSRAGRCSEKSSSRSENAVGCNAQLKRLRAAKPPALKRSFDPVVGWTAVGAAAAAAARRSQAHGEFGGPRPAPRRSVAVRSIASAAPTSPPPSRKNRRRRSRRSSAASGTISAASPRNSPTSTGITIDDPDNPDPADVIYDPISRRAFQRDHAAPNGRPCSSPRISPTGSCRR